MRKTAFAALALLACLAAGTPARGQLPARTWEVSPQIGVYHGSGSLGGVTEPLAGLRLGYNINRWWQVELDYSLVQDLNVQQNTGYQLKPVNTQFGQVWQQIEVLGRAKSDGDFLNLNVSLVAPPVKRRWVFYGSTGLGYATFEGFMTQAQIDEAYPLGPSPTPDTFWLRGPDPDNPDREPTQAELQEPVDEYVCFDCNLVWDDPNDPLIPNVPPADVGCDEPFALGFPPDVLGQDPQTCFATVPDVPQRNMVESGRSLPTIKTTQWSFGGGARYLLTDTMALRLDLRNYIGLQKSFNAQVFTVGLSFFFGGEGPLDDDGDGIPNFRDLCPETPIGATVDKKGCPSDGDGDEVLDGLDACPDTPAGWPTDSDGCPLDTDADGVPDGRDSCANTPEGAVVDFEGCPVDSDGDGVPDGIDQCALTPQGAVVDEQGCPVDSDGDGVADGIDQCANTPAGLPVDPQGCPIDSDGDGLKDDVDVCPAFNGPGGVDEEGCPRFRLDKTTRIPMPDVTFATGSAVLSDAARLDLVALAEALHLYSDVTIEIEGHTDDVGSERDNFVMSMERARAVDLWLRDAGIDPARMTVRGFGEIRPIADNSTAEGRTQNRRIEVLVTGTLAPAEEETD
jgi:outer membrane protein OmpA-like peptidoglycan-associated protein